VRVSKHGGRPILRDASLRDAPQDEGGTAAVASNGPQATLLICAATLA